VLVPEQVGSSKMVMGVILSPHDLGQIDKNQMDCLKLA
jgi:hypothetical protein